MAALTLARAYLHSFDTHPNTTLAITGGCLSAFGDVVAQVAQNVASVFFLSKLPLNHLSSLNLLQIERNDREERRPFDANRTTRFFCYGLAMSVYLGRSLLHCDEQRVTYPF
jgi:protein Mpv17